MLKTKNNGGAVDKLESTPLIPEYIFGEVSQLSAIAFNFSEKADPINQVSSLVPEMRHFSPKDYLVGTRVLNPDPCQIAPFIENLTAQAAKLIVVSPSFRGKTKLKAKWYDTDYNLLELPSQTETWKNVKASKYHQLHLPGPNELIPEDFSLVGEPAASQAEKENALNEPPEVIRNDSQWTLWHKVLSY